MTSTTAGSTRPLAEELAKEFILLEQFLGPLQHVPGVGGSGIGAQGPEGRDPAALQALHVLQGSLVGTAPVHPETHGNGPVPVRVGGVLHRGDDNFSRQGLKSRFGHLARIAGTAGINHEQRHYASSRFA